ncbi:MAG: NUDIX domain-containing protein [Candidatus Sericytochromatia bacterium]
MGLSKLNIRSFCASVFIIKTFDNSNDILLLKRSDTETLSNEWCQVAGKIENNERAWETVLREIDEETSLNPNRLYSADICEQFYNIQDNCIEIIPVFVAFIDKKQEIVLNEEHSEYKWLSFNEAIELLPFIGQKNILAQIKKYFIDNEPNKNLEIKLDGKIIK